jgi:hypothetical protein
VFLRVILDAEAESGMHSHLGEAGFTWPGSNFCYFNCSGDRTRQQHKGPSNGVLMVGHFIFFTQTASWGLFCFVTERNYHGNNILSVCMSKKACCLKKLKLTSLSMKGHV